MTKSLAVVCFVVSALCLQVNNTRALSVEDFFGMSTDDQRSIVRESLSRWRDGARNLSVEFTTMLTYLPVKDGVVMDGPELPRKLKYEHKMFFLDGDWRGEHVWYQYSNDGNDEIRTSRSASNFRRHTGHYHSWLKHYESPDDTVYGRIRVQPSSTDFTNRYMYWLDPRPNVHPSEFKIADAISCCSEASVSFVRNTVGGVDMEYEEDDHQNHKVRRRRYSLDPRYEWFPVKAFLRVDGANGWWYESSTSVEELREVNGASYPWRIVTKEFNNAGAAAGTCSKYSTTVASLTVGDVTDENIDVMFPDGAVVQDEIRDKWLGIDPSLAMTSPNTASDKGGIKWRLIINVVLMVVIAGAIIGYRAKKRRVN